MVWNGSYTTGNTYEGRGVTEYSREGLQKDLDGIWEPVWRHQLSADLKESLAYLESRYN